MLSGRRRETNSRGSTSEELTMSTTLSTPILARHGVFTIPNVLAERTEERQTKSGGNLIYRILTIEYTFYSADGTSLKATVMGEGMDSGDKAANKAMAVGHKYALLQALCIPTEDMIDPDSEVVERSSPRNVQHPHQDHSEDTWNPAEAYHNLLQIAPEDRVKSILKMNGVASMKSIERGVYEKVKAMLQTRNDADLQEVGA